MQRQPAFDQTFSDALDRALQGVLGRTAKVTSFYVDPGLSARNPDVYVELLKKIFSPDLVNALVDNIGIELSKSFGFPFPRDMNGRLSEYVDYARQPLQLKIEPESGSTLVLDSDREVKVTLANRTVGEMTVKNCELKLSPEISFLEPDTPSYGVEGRKLNPGEAHIMRARIRGSQIGQARVTAQGTIVDLRGRTRVVAVASTLFVVEREGRLSTGSAIADSLLLGGLPRQSAVVLTGAASDEKDNLIQGFCSIAPKTTVYVSSDVNRSTQLHNFYPELRLVVCGPQADLLPNTELIQISRTLQNIGEIDDLLTHALETIREESPRVVIQLISDILLVHKEVATRHWLADMLPRLRARGCTVLAELNLGMHEAREANALFDLFDGCLDIVEDDETGQAIRFIRVRNLRGHKYLPHQALLTSPREVDQGAQPSQLPAISPSDFPFSDSERRLVAIMFTDMVGYTSLAQSNEPLALKVLDRHNQLIRPILIRYRGREVKTMGDSFMVEFESALDATNCALDIQRALHDYNATAPGEWKIALRIGIHLGDVVHSQGDLLGDAVNVASRIQPMADPEGVCISQQVYDQVRNKLREHFVKMERRDLKNVQYPVDIYKIALPWEEP